MSAPQSAVETVGRWLYENAREDAVNYVKSFTAADNPRSGPFQSGGPSQIDSSVGDWKRAPDGSWIPVKRRRRRKRMLTCSDKSDIAFLRGQLGGGELGRAAITALLSRCG